MDYEQFLELVKARRSIRSFKPNPIPIGYINKILEAARWAPSGANSQPWEFIVVKDKVLKDEFVNVITQNCLPIRHGLKDASIFIIVCGDTRRKIFYPRTRFDIKNGKIKIIENPVLNIESIFYSSLANATLYIHLASRTLGLGSQWITATTQPRIESEVKQLLKIPEYLGIYDTVALGYPDTIPVPRGLRTLQDITHFNQYNKSKSKTDNELVKILRGIIGPNIVYGTKHCLYISHIRRMLLEVAETFRQRGATSLDTAMTSEELDLPPIFKQMMQLRLGQLGVFVEVNNKYYLLEERFKEFQMQFSAQ